MRELGRLGVHHDQAAPGERVEHRAGVGPLALRQARAQLGQGNPAPGGPAVLARGGHPPEQVPGELLPLVRQLAGDRLGAGLDRPGDPARALVAGPGKLLAVAVLPGQGQSLGD